MRRLSIAVLVTFNWATAQVSNLLDMTYGQGSERKVLAGQRVMQTFDFEERALHFNDLPRKWRKTSVRAGFPHYAGGRLDQTHQRSGEYSFRLIPDGGSVGFEYDHKDIPAKPGSDFQITGYVHFEHTLDCRAQITCALTDRKGMVIPGSLFKSPLVSVMDQDPSGWAKLEVYLPGNFSEARYITVGLWLLQQEEWNQDESGSRRIFKNNVKAEAWFDDISIFQLPRVILRSTRMSNVFSGTEPVTLEVEVEGVGVLDYQAQLSIRNSHNQDIRNERWILSGVEGEKKVRPIPLGQLSAGWYQADLRIHSAGQLVATRHLQFVKLASMNQPSHVSGQGFGVIMMDDETPHWSTVVHLLRNLNSKRVKLPVWKRSDQKLQAVFSNPNFDQNLIELQKNNIQVIAAFSEVSNVLAQKMKLHQPSLMDVLSMDVNLWRPQVAYVLAQYARQVPYWQIGGDFTDTHIWDPRIRPVMESLRREFDQLVKDTVLAVPLNSMFEVNQPQVGTSHVALSVPSSISPDQIPDYLKDCINRGFSTIWATVNPLDEGMYDPDQRIIDFAQRIVFAKAGGAETVFIDRPWERRESNARVVTEPTLLYPIYRTISEYLGGSTYVGRFDLAAGVPALIFDRGGQGFLITWNENYDPYQPNSSDDISLYLGANPQQIDLFGNSQELPKDRLRTRLNITHWPVLITGVDSRIARLRSSLTLTPDVIDAGIARKQLTLTFENPFNSVISGTMRILLDGRKNRNWQVDPLTINFFLQPGQKMQQPLSMKLPSNELGGQKKLQTYFSIDAERNYRFQASVPFKMELTGIDVSIFTRKINQTDLLLQQVVTNESQQEISLNSFVDLPDRDHWERTIPHLQPGATVTKTYLVKNAAKWVGRYVRIGLYDPKGTKRVNYLVEIN